MSDAVTSVPNPASADQVDRRASEFVLRRYDRDHWDDADQAELDAWLDASLSHRTAYWRLKAIWIRANRLDALRPASLPPGPNRRQRSTLFRFKFAAAATFVALLCASAWYLRLPSIQTFATAVGERQNLTLSDGSLIELTTNSAVRIAMEGATRNVWLDKGEAYFRVTHNSNRPFVLRAGKFRIVDLGTAFSVRRDTNRLDVTVAQGRVQIEPADRQRRQSAVVLKAGQFAIATAQAISVHKKTNTEIDDILSWRKGFLVFRHAELADAVAEFNRYNHTKILITDPAIAKMLISARLPATDVAVFARMARDFLGLRVIESGNEIRLSAKGT